MHYQWSRCRTSDKLGYDLLATCELVDTILTTYSDVDEDFKRGGWPKAVVIETVPGREDIVGRLQVKSAASSMYETYENCVFSKPVTEGTLLVRLAFVVMHRVFDDVSNYNYVLVTYRGRRTSLT